MSLNLFAPASEQIEWLVSRKVSSLELLEAYIAYFNRINPSINAIVATDLESARQRAKEVDQRRSNGAPIGALQGLPMTLKDSYDLDGLPAVCGAPEFANRPSKVADAFIAKCLKKADAIIWGKTNTPLYAADVQTYNKVYGTTNNPYDLSRTPGGSSGGAAAALASGLTPLEVGSDIGGSLRTPAHYCGLVTLKPTYGVISLKGHVPPSPNLETAAEPDLAVAGPMARTIDDLALLFSILAPNSKAVSTPESLSQLRVGVWKEPIFALGKEVAKAVEKVTDIFVRAKATVQMSKPDFDAKQLLDVYQRLVIPIMTEELPFFAKTLFKMGRPVAQWKAKKGDLSFWSTILAATQSKEAFLQAEKERTTLKNACQQYFEQHDVLVAPVVAVPAIQHNQKGNLYQRHFEVDGQKIQYTRFFEWICLATTCHLPSLVIPVRQTTAGLPIGIQLIGKEGDDNKLIAIGRLLMQEIGTLERPKL